MKRQMTVVLPLSEAHRARIACAAETQGFEARFFTSDAEALPYLAETEIAFGSSASLAKNAPKLRWLCTPSAGVNQFLAPDCFASPDAVLTNSSGAYGVTIAEHIIMLILEHQRRKPEYDAIVRRREWVRNLPIRSIKDSRITLLESTLDEERNAHDRDVTELRNRLAALEKKAAKGPAKEKHKFGSVITGLTVMVAIAAAAWVIVTVINKFF